LPDPQDTRTILVTAKSKSGKTNLLLLDAKNQPMYTAEIIVSAERALGFGTAFTCLRSTFAVSQKPHEQHRKI
jgi:hypothetical protein